MVVYPEHYTPRAPVPKPPVATYPLSAKLAERRFRRPDASMRLRDTAAASTPRGEGPVQQLLRPAPSTPRPLSPERRPVSPQHHAVPYTGTTLAPAAARPLRTPPDHSRLVAFPSGVEVAEALAEPPLVHSNVKHLEYAAATVARAAAETRATVSSQNALRQTARAAEASVLEKHAAKLALAKGVDKPSTQPAVDEKRPLPSRHDLYQRLYNELVAAERRKPVLPRFRTAALKCTGGIFGPPPGEAEPEFEEDIRRDDFYFARLQALEAKQQRDAENKRRAQAGREEQNKRRARAFEKMLALNEESSVRKCTALFNKMLKSNGVESADDEAQRMSADLVRALQRGQVKEPTPRQRSARVAEWDPRTKRPEHKTLLSEGTQRIVDEFRAAWSQPERVKYEYQTESAIELESAMWLEAQLDAVHDATNPSDDDDD